MLEDTNTAALESSSDVQTVMVSRELLERLQGELKFSQARIEALNFEVARLKKWRFGSSSESLDSSTQAVLFDHILADTALEDIAAKEATQPASGTPRTKGKAVRQSLPQNLPRIDHHYELEQTHCSCGLLPDDSGRTDARADHRQGHPRSGLAGSSRGGQA